MKTSLFPTDTSYSGHSDVGTNYVVFSPDGKLLASGGRDNAIRLCDLAAGKYVATWNDSRQYGVYCLAFSPDGKTLASGGACLVIRGKLGPADRDIHLWDVATGKRTAVLKSNLQSVNSLAISPDGKTLASAGFWDKNISIWDLATAKKTCELVGHTDGVNCLAISPDGKTLASGSKDKTIKLWDLQGK